MSNLIKSVYFSVDPSKVRLIDSDEQIEEYIPSIFEREEAEDFHFQTFGESLSEGEEENHSDGLSVISMNDVAREEREKISAELQQEREDILTMARQEAEEIVEQARAQAGMIQEQARAEGEKLGREDGKIQAALELEQKRQELEEEYQGLCQELEKQREELEPVFANLVASLVRKITGVVCENKKDVILYLIGNAVRNLEKTKQIIIRVSKRDMGRVSSRKATFKSLAKDVQELDVVEDASLEENQCIIETDSKVIDCSLDAQLENLEEHIKMLVF
ncbi:MAG TPA: hypothetical protein DDY31_13565 [Lachnospiraceae bacterium]|nr:hypothetical protein [Lachnospiraceae bacterium]